jgi:formate--tetrahydrofolate ligase
LNPSVCVVVATVRALKMHGGVAKSDLGREDVAAVTRGISNLARHVENMGKFGLPVVVALNRFTSDTDAEIVAVQAAIQAAGAEAILCTHWGDGAKGAADLARAVQAHIAAKSARFAPLYPDAMPLADKIRTIAQQIYRARDIALPADVAKRLARFEELGFGHLPVCIAKTQYSFSADPTKLGAPVDHVLPVREVRLSAGAGFIVAVCGDIMTMPGLPRRSAAETIGLDGEGRIEGLF